MPWTGVKFDEIGADLRATHDRLAQAGSVIVVGGGAAAVSSAVNVARTWPGKRVDLYFPKDRGLVEHHPRAWERVERRLGEVGVVLHPGHRAVIPDGFACDQITSEPVQWSTGQPTSTADAVLLLHLLEKRDLPFWLTKPSTFKPLYELDL